MDLEWDHIHYNHITPQLLEAPNDFRFHLIKTYQNLCMGRYREYED